MEKIDSDEFGGLSSLLQICEGAHVMLIKLCIINYGLCNGGMDVVRNIVYQDGQCPPSLSLAAVV